MMTELVRIEQQLSVFALVLSVQVALVLLLRKPLRLWLGAIACYRLWTLVLLWLPLYAAGKPLLALLQSLLLTSGGAVGQKAGVDFTAPLDRLQFTLQPFSFAATDGGDIGVANWWPPFTLIWLVGILLLVLWLALRIWLFDLRVKEQAKPIATTDWQKFPALNDKGVQAFTLAGLHSAALYGLYRPVLLLPETFTQTHDADQQHIIQAHEAVHLRRHDNVWNLLASLLVITFWWNPLLWYAMRCYRFDQEASCDAQALNTCTHTQQQRYSRTLLESVIAGKSIGLQPLLSAWDNLNDLKERIVMIRRHLKSTVNPSVVRTCLLMIALGGMALTLLLSTLLAPLALAAESASNTTQVSQPVAPKEPSQQMIKGAVPIKLAAAQDTQAKPASSGNASENGGQAVNRGAPISVAVGSQFQGVSELLNAKKNDEADKKLEPLVQQADEGKLSPHEAVIAYQMKVQLAISQMKYAEARASMEKAINSKWMTADEERNGLYMIAQIFIQEEKWQQGADALKQWINTYPDKVNANAFYITSVSFYQLKQFDQATVYAEQAYQRDQEGLKAGAKPNGLEGHFSLLTSLYLDKKRYEDAIPLLKELVKQAPDKKAYYLQLAGVYGQVNRYAEAKTVLRDSIARFNDEEARKYLESIEAKIK